MLEAIVYMAGVLEHNIYYSVFQHKWVTLLIPIIKTYLAIEITLSFHPFQ